MRARGPEGRRAQRQEGRKGRRVEGQKGTRTGEPAGRRAGGHEGTRAGGQVGQRAGGHEEKRRCAAPPLAPAIGGEMPLASLPLRRRRPRRRHSRRVGSAALFVRRPPVSLQPRTSKTSERAPPAHASILSASCSRSLRASSPFARVVHFLTARMRSAPRRRSRARRTSSPQYAWRESARRVELGAESRRGRPRCARTRREPPSFQRAARARCAPSRRSCARRASSPRCAWRENARRVELGANPYALRTRRRELGAEPRRARPRHAPGRARERAPSLGVHGRGIEPSTSPIYRRR